MSMPIVSDSMGGRLVRLCGLGLVALALGACASMSEKDCLSVDWADQGYRDGRDGHPPSRARSDLRDEEQRLSAISAESW